MPILARFRGLNIGPNAQPAKPSPVVLSSRYGASGGLDIDLPDSTSKLRAPANAGHTCAAADCTGSWVLPWKSRTRPIFENAWGCSSRCIQAIVSAAVRREMGEGLEDVNAEPHRHRVPLGLVLLAQNWITHPQLQAALEAQRQSGFGRIGDWLVQTCGLDQQHITRGLGMQWSCPIFTTDGFDSLSMALVMPRRFIAEFGVVPLRVEGRSQLYLACVDRIDPATAFAIEQMTMLKVETGLLDDQQFARARGAVMAADSVPLTMVSAPDLNTLSSRIARCLEQQSPVASRLVRVHQYFWLRTWTEENSVNEAGHLPKGIEGVHDYLFTLGSAVSGSMDRQSS